MLLAELRNDTTLFSSENCTSIQIAVELHRFVNVKKLLYLKSDESSNSSVELLYLPNQKVDHLSPRGNLLNETTVHLQEQCHSVIHVTNQDDIFA